MIPPLEPILAGAAVPVNGSNVSSLLKSIIAAVAGMSASSFLYIELFNEQMTPREGTKPERPAREAWIDSSGDHN
jgi:hypothetical protein